MADIKEFMGKVGDKLEFRIGDHDKAREFWDSKITFFSLQVGIHQAGTFEIQLVLKSIEERPNGGWLVCEIKGIEKIEGVD